MSERGAGISLSDLVRRFEPQIRGYIRHRAGDAAVDDLYQETVAVALAQSSHFQHQGDPQFLSWIYAIARHVQEHARRKADRFRAVHLCGPDSTAPGVPESSIRSKDPTPSRCVSGSEDRHRLMAALDALPEEYRRVLMLYRIEERPLAEVAHILNKSKQATCNLLVRAVDFLHEVLTE